MNANAGRADHEDVRRALVPSQFPATGRGVQTVFVSPPDLAGPEDVLRLTPVAAAFA